MDTTSSPEKLKLWGFWYRKLPDDQKFLGDLTMVPLPAMAGVKTEAVVTPPNPMALDVFGHKPSGCSKNVGLIFDQPLADQNWTLAK